MTPGTQARTPALTRAALAGLGAGAAVSSLMGPGIFAGFTAVALAAGVVMALGSLGAPGPFLSLVTAGLAILFPLAAAVEGEPGILWASGVSFVVLSAAYVLRGLRRHCLQMLSESLMVVLHLGLLGSYLVLVATLGNRLLVALVLLVAAFEAAYGILAARQDGKKRPPARRGGSAPQKGAAALFPPLAVAGGLVACQVAALLTRFVLPSPLGAVSLLVLGASVAAAAALGHAGAAVVAEDLHRGPGRRGLDPAVFGSVNALLLAAGAFYYGFRLYLA
jgi:hypothetical protein